MFIVIYILACNLFEFARNNFQSNSHFGFFLNLNKILSWPDEKFRETLETFQI